MRLLLVTLTLVVGLDSTLQLEAQTLPKPSGPVNDFAKVLGAESRTRLTTLIEGVESETSAEIAVATVTSLDGMSVEEYATRLFNAWGVGRQSLDNGVLVLVAPTEREIRIEVGYGLEGVLPDGLTGAIIREQFIPRFRDGDFDRGIVDGVSRVAEIVRKGEKLTPEQLAALQQPAGSGGIPWWIILPFMTPFVSVGGFMLGLGFKNRGGFEKLFGALFGGIPLLLSLIVPWTFVALVGLALVVFVVGYLKGDTWLGGKPDMTRHNMSPKSWRNRTHDAIRGLVAFEQLELELFVWFVVRLLVGIEQLRRRIVWRRRSVRQMVNGLDAADYAILVILGLLVGAAGLALGLSLRHKMLRESAAALIAAAFVMPITYLMWPAAAMVIAAFFLLMAILGFRRTIKGMKVWQLKDKRRKEWGWSDPS